jgi:hypothetical protein
MVQMQKTRAEIEQFRSEQKIWRDKEKIRLEMEEKYDKQHELQFLFSQFFVFLQFMCIANNE